MRNEQQAEKPRYCSLPGLARTLSATLVMLVLAACSASGTRREASPEQPLARLSLPADIGDAEMARIMAAEFALEAGNLEAATRAYRLAAADSSDPEVLARTAELMLQSGDSAGADAMLARLETLEADPLLLAELRARQALTHGHREQAEAELRLLLARGDRESWQQVARLLASARDPALAGLLLERLATAESLPADDETVWIAISQLGEKLGRHDFAARIAAAAAERFGSAGTLAWAAHLTFVNGDIEAGKRLYTQALQAAPEDVQLRLAYAGALAETGALVEAGEVLAAGPQTLATFAARAGYAAQAEDDAALARVYEDLKAKAPRLDGSPAFLLGQLADTLDKPDEALKWFAEVPLESEQAFAARARRTVLLDQAGSHAEALSLARQLQQLYNDDDELARRAFQLEAFLHTRVGDARAAVETYDRALDRLPDDAELLYGRALTAADAGELDAAIRDLRRVLALDPDNVEALNALGYTLADANRNLDEAAKLLQQALAGAPDEPAIIDSWGWLQYRLGNLEDAEQHLRRAWELQPDPDIGVHLGEVLWVQGEREQAQAIFDAVRQENPDSRLLKDTLKRLKP